MPKCCGNEGGKKKEKKGLYCAEFRGKRKNKQKSNIHCDL